MLINRILTSYSNNKLHYKIFYVAYLNRLISENYQNKIALMLQQKQYLY